MTKKSSLIVWFSLFILLVSMLGCAPAPTTQPASAEPTLDMNMLRTEVAQIVLAELTAQAALNPTATSAPELAPTQPIEATTAAETATAIPTFTLAPTATTKPAVSNAAPAPTQNTYTDQATLVSQSPANWTFMVPYQDFDAVWVIKNTGKRTWNGSFYFKGTKLNGDEFGPTYLPNSSLGVNDTVELRADMIAPEYIEGGNNTHTAYLQVINDDGVVFFSSSLSITVQK